jgi:hypothetical protein
MWYVGMLLRYRLAVSFAAGIMCLGMSSGGDLAGGMFEWYRVGYSGMILWYIFGIVRGGIILVGYYS